MTHIVSFVIRTPEAARRARRIRAAKYIGAFLLVALAALLIPSPIYAHGVYDAAVTVQTVDQIVDGAVGVR